MSRLMLRPGVPAEMVQVSVVDDVTVTVSSESDVGLMAIGVVDQVVSAGSVNVMVCVARSMVSVCVISGAAAWVALPAWFAVMVQVPALVAVREPVVSEVEVIVQPVAVPSVTVNTTG